MSALAALCALGAVSVAGASMAEAAEEWPFKDRPRWGSEWPFNRDAGPETTGSIDDPVEQQPAPQGSETPASPRPNYGYEPVQGGAGDIQPVQRGPISILPPTTGPSDASLPSGEPQDLILYPSGRSPAAASDLPARALGARPGEVGTGIEIGTLGDVDEASAGLLDDQAGGLGPRIWEGTERRFVELNLGKLVVPAPTPAMADLTRRLLLTSARAPGGPTEGLSLLALRLDRLNDAGYSSAVSQLRARSGGSRPSAAAAVEYAMAALADDDGRSACSYLTALPVGGEVAIDPVAAFAVKLSIYCQISADDKLSANLSGDLAREQGLDDEFFLAMAAAATDGLKLRADMPPVIDPLTYRMMGLANRALPDDALSRLHPSLLPVLAGDREIDGELRIAIAEKAASLGLVTGNEIGSAYLALSYTREDVEGVRAGREPASPYRRRALFHQAVLDERVPGSLADILTALFQREVGGLAYPATLQVHKGSLSSVPASGALSAFSPFAARAFLELGDRVRASMWLAALENGGTDPRTAREVRALLRLLDPSEVRVGQGDLTVVPAYLQAALDDLPQGGDARDFAAVEIVLLDALGAPIPQSVYDAVLVTGDLPRGAAPAPEVMRRLKMASEAGRVGETVLVALIALGEAGPGELHSQPMAAIVSALQQVGLDSDARRLAFEALSARSSAIGAGR
ncbi:MAG: hypothetical protein RLN89_05675 [Parvibaculum sp.]